MRYSLPFAIVSAVILVPQAVAGMVGAVVSGSYEFPRGTVDPTASFTATVTNGVEYQWRFGFGPYRNDGYDIDIKDTAIRFTFHLTTSQSNAIGWTNTNSPTYFDGYVFRDVNNVIPDFTGISIGDKSASVPFSDPFFGAPWRKQISVEDANTLVINLAGLAGHYDGDYIEFNVTMAPAPSAVPALLGLAGVVARRRRYN